MTGSPWKRRMALILGVGVLALPGAGLGPSAAALDTAPSPVRVEAFFPRGALAARCDRVFPVPRRVRAPAVLTGALASLVKGPTASERRRGYGGWFSQRTAGTLRRVSLTGGTAFVDFDRELRRLIPNASSSCGSALLLAQLDRTVTQFPTVRRAVYSLGGSRAAFYEWLQLSPP